MDLVVLTTKYSQEQLKEILITADSLFYLVASKDPRATYKVLWYRLGSDDLGYASRPSRCKVDILQPGIMNIPDVPNRHIEMIKDLPVMPLLLLLFMKLQGWTDHRDSPKDYMRLKKYDDLLDIMQLLDVAMRRGENIGRGTRWMPEEFVRAATGRMKEHITQAPAAEAKWKAIGYKPAASTRYGLLWWMPIGGQFIQRAAPAHRPGTTSPHSRQSRRLTKPELFSPRLPPVALRCMDWTTCRGNNRRSICDHDAYTHRKVS